MAFLCQGLVQGLRCVAAVLKDLGVLRIPLRIPWRDLPELYMSHGIGVEF